MKRFWDKVDKSGGADACWPWTACLDSRGYGQLTIGSRTDGSRRRIGAHRMAFILANGEIPPGEGSHGTCVMHACDNPPCCNPAHLSLGTNHENRLDSARKGRTASGERSGVVALTDQQVRDIRANAALCRVTQRELAKRFGCSQQQIGRIINNTSRKISGSSLP